MTSALKGWLCLGLFTAAVAMTEPPTLAAQTTERETEGSDLRSAPVAAGPDSDTATKAESNAAAAATYEVELGRRFHELRNEVLDERGKFIDRVLIFFGVVIALAGFLAFGRFRQIERDAGESAAAAKNHSVDAEKHSVEAEKHSVEAERLVGVVRDLVKKASAWTSEIEAFRRTTAESVDEAPGRASAASARVTDDPQASAVDKAIAWAIIHQRQGQRAKALELWRAIGAIAEPIGEVDLAARAWFSIAYLSSRRVPEQMDYLDKAIALQPDFAEAYVNRANAKMRLGRHEEAVADCDRAIALQPNLVEAYLNRGSANGRMGGHEEAVADCDRAIALQPNLAEAYSNRGSAKDHLGRHEEAVADCDKAIALQPNLAEAYLNRGSAKDHLGRHEEAVADYGKAIALQPNFASAYFDRGNAKVKLGRHEEAVADFDKAVALQPNFAVAYFNRASANRELGRHEEAAADLSKSIELDSDLNDLQD